MSDTFVNFGMSTYVVNMFAKSQIKPNKMATAASKINKGLGIADDFFRLPENSLKLAKQFSDNPSIPDIQVSVNTCKSVISAFRCVPTAAYFISGQVFHDSWTDQVLNIILAIARFLSPISWLHRLKAIDLGSHAKWIGYTIMGCFTAVGIGSFINTLRNWSKINTILTGVDHDRNKHLNEMRREIATRFTCDDEAAQKILMDELEKNSGSELLSEALEVGCAPWENGIVLSNNFAFVIVGAALNLVSASYKLMRL